MGVLQLLGPDQTTVLFDFADPTGAANPNTLITRLGAGLDFGNVDPALALQDAMYGARLLERRHPPVEVVIPLIASATTDDNLWAGVGQLARFLVSADRDHPLYLKWTELSSTYYYDVIGAVQLPQIIRGATVGALAAARKSTMGPIPVVLLRQPWRRGAQVTTSADTVEGDPATGTPDQSRIASLTVSGDLPTPGQVKAVMDSGSAVASVLVGHRARGSKAADVFTDYLTDTGWFQCEATGRSWTITLSNDTAAAADGALASPGSGNVVAQVSGAGGSVGNMVRRVRATRTTLMDSLRGSWIPYLRVKATAASVWEIQMSWGPSTADPPAFTEDAVTHDTSAAASFGYVELPLGTIHLSELVVLSGLAVEIWAKRVSGTGNLNLDLVDLWPAQRLGAIVVQGSSSSKATGQQLATPVTNPGGGSAGTPIGSQRLRLDTLNDNAGVAPNTGFVAAATGRYRFTFDLFSPNLPGAGPGGCNIRVRNITGSSTVVTRDVSSQIPVGERRLFTLEADLTAGTSYQAQVAMGTDVTDVYSITSEFLPALASGEGVRTDPTRYAVDRLDSSGNLAGYLTIQGTLPVMLEPGENHLKVRADDVPLAGYAENEHKLDRDPVVTVTYDPRYAV